jgi:hypothetical protein
VSKLTDKQLHRRRQRLYLQLPGLLLFQNMTVPRKASSKISNKKKSTFVTVWDPLLHTHVWLPPSYYEFKNCGGNEPFGCPDPCGGPYAPLSTSPTDTTTPHEPLRGNDNPPHDLVVAATTTTTITTVRPDDFYPLYFDRADQLCKSSHPSVMESPARPFAGQCDCYGTCYTPAVTRLGSIWPWSNATLRDEYYDYFILYKHESKKSISRIEREEKDEDEVGDDSNGGGDAHVALDEFVYRQKTRHKAHQRSCLVQRWTGMKPKQYYRESTACEHVTFMQQQQQQQRKMILEEQNSPITTTVSAMLAKNAGDKSTTKEDDKNAIGTNNFTLPCPAHAAGLHHLYFIPEAKLIFCGIPKVGISEWIKFFRYTWGAGDYLSLSHFKSDKDEFHLAQLPHHKANALLKDPTWTKAVFFRDPAERLLSAYLDKIVKHAFTQKYFHIGSLRDDPRPMLNFSEFVDLISANNTDCGHKRGVHYCTDPHWRPQLLTCGLDSILPLFDFVGSFNHLPEHSRLLLERVGLWDKYGATFDDTTDAEADESKLCDIAPPPPRVNNKGGTYSAEDVSNTEGGFNQRLPQGNHHAREHGTGSSTKMQAFYTPELLAKVRAAYAMDYAVWDEIKDRPPQDVAAAYDMVHVKKACVAV